MKFGNQCPKCQSKDVVELKGSRYNTQNFVYLNSWGTKYLILDRYLCTRCGFTEEYVDVDDKLEKERDELLAKKKVTRDDFV